MVDRDLILSRCKDKDMTFHKWPIHGVPTFKSDAGKIKKHTKNKPIFPADFLDRKKDAR